MINDKYLKKKSKWWKRGFSLTFKILKRVFPSPSPQVFQPVTQRGVFDQILHNS